MSRPPNRDQTAARTGERGFSLVELLIGITVAGLIGSSLFVLMAGQNRGYSQVKELADVHGTLRSTANLLAWDLRYASASSGDFYAVNPNSVSLRVFRGSGVICSKDPGGWYGIVRIEGDRSFGSDSALVFAAGTVGPFDDQWRVIGLQNVTTPGGSTCDWPGTPPIEARLHLLPGAPSDTLGIRVGGPVHSFAAVTYGPFLWNGRWWLGRQVDTNPWEPLAGPLPDSTGLRFTYYDATGATTTNPGQVEAIEFSIRAESTKRLDANRGMDQDSIRTKVHTRG